MGSKIRLSITIDEDMHRTLSTIAEHSDQSLAGVVRDYLEIGRESLGFIASSLEAAATLEEDQKARIRERMDEAAHRIASAEAEVRRVQEEAARDLVEEARSVRPEGRNGLGAPAESIRDPRPVTRGFPSPKKGGQGPARKERKR